jgi:hypothetical protein
MDLSSLVFALGLFSAGVLLIFMISGDFKEKKRQVQRIPDSVHRSPHATHNVPAVARQPSTPSRVNTGDATRTMAVTVETADQLQSLNVAVVRETFERFTR